MKTLVLLSTAVALLIMAPFPAAAHHSGAMFDRSKTVTLKGVVIEYEATNPHGWIRLMVRDSGVEGGGVEWAIETASPSSMRRLGLVPSKLKAGDTISLRTHPLRDGRRGGSLVDLILANGERVGNPLPEAR